MPRTASVPLPRGGEVRKVLVVISVASKPEAAAHNALGEPQERSAQLRTRH